MRWLYLTILIWVILLILTGSATQIKNPNQKPSNAQVLGFDLCADKPCFLTIVPGITTFDKAASILNTYSKGEWLLDDTNSISIGQGYRVTIYGSIDTIGVEYRYNAPEFLVVGDFVELYGLPCLVGISHASGDLTLIYPYLMVEVIRARDEQRLNLGSFVHYFQLIDPSTRFGTSLDLCTFAKKFPLKRCFLGKVLQRISGS